MSVKLIQPDDKIRRAILLLESLALLHDYGKLSDGFLHNTASDKPKPATYHYEARVRVAQAVLEIDANQLKKGRTKEIIEAIQQAHGDVDGAPFKDLEAAGVDVTTLLTNYTLESWAGGTFNLAELLALAGQWALNIDWQTVLHKTMQPALLVGRLHGAAHYEKRGVGDVNNPPFAQVRRSNPFGLESPIGSLNEALASLPFDRLGEILTGDRYRWLSDMRTKMTQAPADTRRAINEVSLWDWSYVVATLVKPAAYALYQNGWPANNDLDTLAYRPLAIRLNRLEQYTQTDRITDLLGVGDELDRRFAMARTLLEETYALGNRLYHDETGDYYLVPDLNDEGQQTLTTDLIGLFPADLAPTVVFHESITIGELDAENLDVKTQAVRRLVAEPRRDRRAVAPDGATLEALAAPWNDGRPPNAELCSVCRVRPVGYGEARKRRICRQCLTRRSGRAIKWLDDLEGNLPEGKRRDDTIWTDEVADNNGRLALFVGALGLEDWLDGDVFRHLPADRTKPDVGKMPSPARLYRVAETARAFWQDVNAQLVPRAAGRAPYRLEIRPDPPLDVLINGQAYELRLDGRDLAVVWDGHNGRFLTAENLAYFHKRWQLEDGKIAELLRGGHVTVVEPSAFLRPSAEKDVTFDHSLVTQTDSYAPFIPLLAEPSVCMALIPADKALALCREVWRKYQAEMGRVADRLPLSIGLIFFPRHTPMSAVLDAGQRLLRRVEQPQAWKVDAPVALETIEDGQTFLRLALQREENGPHIVYRYPAKLGDGALDDAYYPYLYTVPPAGKGHDREVKHVTALTKGETVYIRPGAFDFEFLDTTGRRFEIAYEPIAGRRVSRPTRPFLPADLERLDRIWKRYSHLKTSQQYQALQSIESTRDAWYGSDSTHGGDDVFKTFVSHTLGGANWPPGGWRQWTEDERKEMTTAGASGELADLAELHLEILKAKDWQRS